MSDLRAVIQVTKGEPCPACGASHHCAWLSEDPTDAKKRLRCMKPSASSCPEGMRCITDDDGNGGCIFGWEREVNRPKLTVKPRRGTLAQKRIEQLCEDWLVAMSDRRWNALAESLSLPVEALQTLDVGYVTAKQLGELETSAKSDCWTFPMRDCTGMIVGARLRTVKDRAKYQVKHTHAGIFVPDVPQQKLLWIVEGPTDCAAAVALGLDAIGRPNNSMMPTETAMYARWRGYRWAVIVPDNDAKGSQAAREQTAKGARDLCRELINRGIKTVIVQPGSCSDLREYVGKGGKPGPVKAAARNAFKEAATSRNSA